MKPEEKIERAYEELRAIIDGGSESFTHEDAVQYLKDRFAQTEHVCRNDGRCQYAIDSGAEGMGHCPKGKCVMPAQPDHGAVATIHRNEYNEYRLEPHDDFDIKSIPFNVDVPLFKSLQGEWVKLMRGVRVEGDTVVISVKGGNDAARKLCGALIEEMTK